jgi:DHA2 family multidrug resistance protein
VQGLGVSCISVPLATIAFSTLPLELRTEATGIFSLVRNLGSAIGISVTGALLQNNTQVNHAVIAGGVTPFNRTFQSGAALKLLNPVSTQGSALLDSEITRQAYIIAYLDDFKLMLVLTLMALPLVLLIRPAKREVAEDIPDGVTE